LKIRKRSLFQHDNNHNLLTINYLLTFKIKTMKRIFKLASILFITALVFNSCEKEQDPDASQALNKEIAEAVKDEAPIVNNVSENASTAKGSTGARTITLQTNTLSCPGGKCGYGILIGDQNTGGDPGWDGNGGSARFMWYCPNGSNSAKGSGAYLQPYVYYKDQPGQYGNDFGKKYYIQEGVTYNCQISVKLNTGSNTDGYVKYYVNGTEILNEKIRWVTNDAKRNVNAVSLHTFRGGSQEYWKAPVTSSIYYPSASWDAL
jgi:hypothetical protein